MKSVRDTIDEKIRDYAWDNDDEPMKVILDSYSYAMLREELGLDPIEPLDRYHGLIIKVDGDLDDLCQIV